MIIRVDHSGTVEGLKYLVNEVLQVESVQSIFILACDANNFTPATVDDYLKEVSVPLFGGIFPKIVYGNEVLSTGILVAGLSKRATVHIIPDLSDSDINYEDVIDGKATVTDDTRTLLVFVDGFAKRIGALIESLFVVFGLEFNYIGGGAGSLDMKQKPCLFTNQGLIIDSALLVMLDISSGVGVSHGWETVSGPYWVTTADRNRVKTLDWRPAFDVYREAVESHSKQLFSAKNFFDLSKSYPLGISKLGTEKIVRDPLMLGEDGSLICIGEVPEGSYVDILTGNVESLVAAAKKAFAIAENTLSQKDTKRTTLFIDCISRVLFLEENFADELNAVYRKNQPLIGALTIGEIANSRKDYLEFYNKTSVVGILAD